MATKATQTAAAQEITNGMSFDNLSPEQKVMLMALVQKTGGDFSRLTVKQLDPESAEYKTICAELNKKWTEEAESRGVDPKHVFATARKAPTVYVNPNNKDEKYQYGKVPAWFVYDENDSKEFKVSTVDKTKYPTKEAWHKACVTAANGANAPTA